MKNTDNKTIQNSTTLLTEKLYSFTQLCALFSITRQTAYNWIELKILSPRKIRGRVYFLGSDLIKILNETK